MNIGATTGVVLDPTYTGKAVRGLVSELNNNPSRFKGNKILFIHTGKRFLKSNIQSLMEKEYYYVYNILTIYTLV